MLSLENEQTLAMLEIFDLAEKDYQEGRCMPAREHLALRIARTKEEKVQRQRQTAALIKLIEISREDHRQGRSCSVDKYIQKRLNNRLNAVTNDK